MARARRAKPRRSRIVLLLILVVAALLAGGSVALLLFWPGSLTAIMPTQTSPSTVTESSSTPTQPPTPTPSATPARSATPSPSAKPKPKTTAASSAALKALDACRNRVQAADEVLKQARTGVLHWSAHVDAERRAAEGDITPADRQRIFKETRLQGPGDQKRYAAALRAYGDAKDATCGKTKGADAKVAVALAKCGRRSSAQATVMAAAAPAMGDWKQHLADMQRTRELHNADAQQVWIEAYKAAPPNINAYVKAVRNFKAPTC